MSSSFFEKSEQWQPSDPGASATLFADIEEFYGPRGSAPLAHQLVSSDAESEDTEYARQLGDSESRERLYEELNLQSSERLERYLLAEFAKAGGDISRRPIPERSIANFSQAIERIAVHHGLSSAQYGRFVALMEDSRSIETAIRPALFASGESDTLRRVLRGGPMADPAGVRQALANEPELLRKYNELCAKYPDGVELTERVRNLVSAVEQEVRQLAKASGLPESKLDIRTEAQGSWSQFKGMGINRSFLQRTELMSSEFTNTICHELRHADQDATIVKYLLHECKIAPGKPLTDAQCQLLDEKYERHTGLMLDEDFTRQVHAAWDGKAPDKAELVRSELLLLQRKMSDQRGEELEKTEARANEIQKLFNSMDKFLQNPADTRKRLVALAGSEVPTAELLKTLNATQKVLAEHKADSVEAKTALKELRVAVNKHAEALREYANTKYYSGTFSEQDADAQGSSAQRLVDKTRTGQESVLRAMFGESGKSAAASNNKRAEESLDKTIRAGIESILKLPNERLEGGSRIYDLDKPTTMEIQGKQVTVTGLETINGSTYLRDSSGKRYSTGPLMDLILDGLDARSATSDRAREIFSAYLKSETPSLMEIGLLRTYIGALGEGQPTGEERPLPAPESITARLKGPPNNRLKPTASAEPVQLIRPINPGAQRPILGQELSAATLTPEQRMRLEMIRKDIRESDKISPEESNRWNKQLDLSALEPSANPLSALSAEQRANLSQIGKSLMDNPQVTADQQARWRKFVQDLSTVPLNDRLGHDVAETTAHLNLVALRERIAVSQDFTSEQKKYATRMLELAIRNPHDPKIKNVVGSAMTRGHRGSGLEATLVVLSIVVPTLASSYANYQLQGWQPAPIKKAKVN